MAHKEQRMTLEEVDHLQDICEGFTLLQKYDITEKGCQSLDDIKDRLRLHYHKVRNEGHQLQTVSKKI